MILSLFLQYPGTNSFVSGWILDDAGRTLSQTKGGSSSNSWIQKKGARKRGGSPFENTISQLLRILPATISSATSITAVTIPATATPAPPATTTTASTAKAST